MYGQSYFHDAKLDHMYSDMPRKCYKTIDGKIGSFSQLILKKYQTDHSTL